MSIPSINPFSSSRGLPPVAQELTSHEVRQLTDEMMLRKNQGGKSPQQIKEEFLESRKFDPRLSILEELYDQFMAYIDSGHRVDAFVFHPQRQGGQERAESRGSSAPQERQGRTTPLSSEFHFNVIHPVFRTPLNQQPQNTNVSC